MNTASDSPPRPVAELTHAGHSVVVEADAGAGIGFADADYIAAGACIGAAQEAFAQTLVVKVKEPNLDECAMLEKGQILFTYLHLAADPGLSRALMASGAAAIAYETVTAADGGLPLLSPMSEIAGRMSVQVGAHALQRTTGGSGVLLGGVPGVAPARVVVIGRRDGGRQRGHHRLWGWVPTSRSSTRACPACAGWRTGSMVVPERSWPTHRRRGNTCSVRTS